MRGKSSKTIITAGALAGIFAAGLLAQPASGTGAKKGKSAKTKTAKTTRVYWSPALKRPPRQGEEYLHAKTGMVLVWIPPGSFMMGGGKRKDQLPAHRVDVAGFWLGKYEVTNQQYMKFVNQGPYPEPDFMDDENLNAPNQPVVAVKWNHGQAFMRWSGLRMPTEAEWEYVARGGRRFRYPTSTGKLTHELANYWGRRGRDRWLERTSPIGSFPPNPFGIHDMAGNAWEWTSSLYKPYPYRATDGRENLTIKNFRVMRGGSWHFSKRYCEASHRHRFRMHLRLDFVGLRAALSRVPGQ